MGYRGTKKLYTDCSQDELVHIASKRGINETNLNKMTKTKLINKILTAPQFTQTPPRLAQFMAMVGSKYLKTDGDNAYIAEFGAGNGNITRFIRQYHPKAVIEAFEIDEERLSAAKRMHENLKICWNEADVLSPTFLRDAFTNTKEYDMIEFNPAFEKGFEHIFVALQVLKPDGIIIAL